MEVIFCSEKCRDEAWKTYHDVECKVLRDLIGITNKGDTEVAIAVLQNTIKAKKEFENIDNLRQATREIDNCKGKMNYILLLCILIRKKLL